MDTEAITLTHAEDRDKPKQRHSPGRLALTRYTPQENMLLRQTRHINHEYTITWILLHSSWIRGFF